VRAFVELENPRWFYVLPGGDVLVAQSRTLPKSDSGEEGDKQDDGKKGNGKEKEEKLSEGMKKSKTVTGSSPNRITLIRDRDGDGQPELVTTFHEGLHQPFGMALVGGKLFVAATDALWAFDYEKGQTKLSGEGEKIIDLPAGGYNNHWTRNVLASRDGKKLYLSVGSASNVAEHGTAEEMLRANVLEMNLDGTGLRVFASGLRNPVGMAWRPDSDELWVAVNERDELGDELVPDYMTSVKEEGFYGWPYSYWGNHVDPRLDGKRMDLVKKAIVPDVNLGSHTASLGLAFYDAKQFPEKYRSGAFIGQRGSWNRSQFAGYRVAFVPFQAGKPAGEPEDILTGFIANEDEVYGRPVGVAVDAQGALLVADEPGNVIWRVTYR
jgi:glucose/arabinose dehydrogenase